MKYEYHLDDAFMAGGICSDFSFTLFLSDPLYMMEESLKLRTVLMVNQFQLSLKKTMFVYNTENYHQVTEVTKGERVALVVWVESFAHLEEKRALFRDFCDV